jgi:hypothetical protein
MSMVDTQQQHRVNAAKEKHWIGDAKRDNRDLTQVGHQLIQHGKRIEGNFDLEEAKNAVSWVSKRQKILHREQRLGGR